MASSADDACLQPDILSRDDLIFTLKLRQVKEDELDSMDKCHLVQLYNSHVVPLPQRFDHDSRRWRRIYGKLIAKDGRTRADLIKTNKINGFSTKQNGGTSSESDSLKRSRTNDDLHRKVSLNRKRSISDVDILTIDEITPVMTTMTANSSPTKKSKTMDQAPPITKSKRQPITWP